MKTWYKAACSTHKEMINLFVNNVQTTYHYFYGPNGEAKECDQTIEKWLKEHYGCKLELIHHDADLDRCYLDGFKDIKHPRKQKYVSRD